MYQYRLTYRILSLALSCLLLLTAFDYSVNVHYCQDAFAGISFNDVVKSCASKASSCSSMKKISLDEEDPNCCKNKKFHIDDLDEDFTSPMIVDFVDLTFDLDISPDFLASSYVNYQKQAISYTCLLYTSPSPRDQRGSRMPSSA